MTTKQKVLIMFFVTVAISALGIGLSDGILSNYFKETYNVTSVQRGIIEFPRETPGIISIILISFLHFFGDIRLSIIANLTSAIAILIMGFCSPTFPMMLVLLFIYSTGFHLYLPLQDGLCLTLIKDENVGEKMGQYKAISTAFTMLAAIVIFIGFRSGVFSLTTPIIIPFVLAGILTIVVAMMYINIGRILKQPIHSSKKIKIVFRKEYKLYYCLAILNGVQKQVMITFGPWVLIEILNKKADTLAILSIISSFIGVFFLTYVGRWLDRFGVRRLLFADALTFIFVYFAYGVLTTGFHNGTLPAFGVPVFLTGALFVADRISMQLGMVRTVYLQKIAVTPTDITPTLSLGISLDHVVTIICAPILGVVWYSFGPQYIFFSMATLSLLNLFIANKVKFD